MSEHSSSHF